MRPRFPNAKTLFNRFLLPPKSLFRQEFGHDLFQISFLLILCFALVHISIQMLRKSTRIFAPISSNFWPRVLTTEGGGLRRFLPIIPNSPRTPAAKVCHALFASTQHNLCSFDNMAERKLLSICLQENAESG